MKTLQLKNMAGGIGRKKLMVFLAVILVAAMAVGGFCFFSHNDKIKMPLDEALSAYYYNELVKDVSQQQNIISNQKDSVVSWSYEIINSYLEENKGNFDIVQAATIDSQKAEVRLGVIYDNVRNGEYLKVEQIGRGTQSVDGQAAGVTKLKAEGDLWTSTAQAAESAAGEGYKLTDESCAIMASAMVGAMNIDGSLSSNNVSVSEDFVLGSQQSIKDVRYVKQNVEGMITEIVNSERAVEALSLSETNDIDITKDPVVINGKEYYELLDGSGWRCISDPEDVIPAGFDLSHQPPFIEVGDYVLCWNTEENGYVYIGGVNNDKEGKIKDMPAFTGETLVDNGKTYYITTDNKTCIVEKETVVFPGESITLGGQTYYKVAGADNVYYNTSTNEYYDKTTNVIYNLETGKWQDPETKQWYNNGEGPADGGAFYNQETNTYYDIYTNTWKEVGTPSGDTMVNDPTTGNTGDPVISGGNKDTGNSLDTSVSEIMTLNPDVAIGTVTIDGTVVDITIRDLQELYVKTNALLTVFCGTSDISSTEILSNAKDVNLLESVSALAEMQNDISGLSTLVGNTDEGNKEVLAPMSGEVVESLSTINESLQTQLETNETLDEEIRKNATDILELVESVSGNKEEIESKLEEYVSTLKDNQSSDKEELTNNLTAAKEELDSTIATLKEELSTTQSSDKEELTGNLASAKEELESVIAALKEETETTQAADKEELEGKLEQAQTDLEKAIETLDGKVDERVTEEVREINKTIGEQKTYFEGELDSLSDIVEANREDIEDKLSELDEQLSEDISDLNTALEEAKTEFAQNLKDTRDDIIATTSAIKKELKDDIKDTNKELSRTQEDLAATSAAIRQDMEDIKDEIVASMSAIDAESNNRLVDLENQDQTIVIDPFVIETWDESQGDLRYVVTNEAINDDSNISVNYHTGTVISPAYEVDGVNHTLTIISDIKMSVNVDSIVIYNHAESSFEKK